MTVKTSDNKVVNIKNCAKPKMKGRGRSWDTVGRATIDGQEVTFYADTTWGSRFYFEVNGKWYSGEVWDVDILSYDKNAKLVRSSKKTTQL